MSRKGFLAALTAFLLAAPMALATNYKCTASNGCDYNFYNGQQWVPRHVDEGTIIALDGLKELVGTGWSPIG